MSEHIGFLPSREKDEGLIFIKIELAVNLYSLTQQIGYSINAKRMNVQSHKAKKISGLGKKGESAKLKTLFSQYFVFWTLRSFPPEVFNYK